jgi:hypothetical protein
MLTSKANAQRLLKTKSLVVVQSFSSLFFKLFLVCAETGTIVFSTSYYQHNNFNAKINLEKNKKNTQPFTYVETIR